METKVGDYSAAYDVMKEAKILVENRVNLEELKRYGFDLGKGFEEMGWKNFFFSEKVDVMAFAIKEFWCNSHVLKGGIVEGHIRGFKLLFTEETIAETIKCPSEGISYRVGWEDIFGGLEMVNKALFVNYEKLKERDISPVARDLKSHYRVLHKIIAKCVVLKAGSSDIVNYEQKFYIATTWLVRKSTCLS